MTFLELKIFISVNLFFTLILFFSDNFFYSSFYYQILLFAIPLIWPGLAHGSLDLYTASRYSLIKNKKSLLIFLFVYLLIPLIFFCLWLKFPNTLFILFLILSGMHFGISDRLINQKKIKHLEVFIRATIIIIFPIFFHPEETSRFFNFFLINNEFYFYLYSLSNYFFYLLIITIPYFFFKIYFIKKKSVITELIILIFCFLYFKPLISFLIYFCFLHSIRHLNNEQIKFKISLKKLIIKTIPMTSVVITFFSLSAIYFGTSDDIGKKLNYFITALSSLTISHVLLINFFNKD